MTQPSSLTKPKPWQQRMAVNSPNPNPNEKWLAQVQEQALDSHLEIVDAHHHLWDRAGFRYLLEEYSEDIGVSGFNVTASIFVQCRSMYRADGPEHEKPIGEVEFIRGIAAQARSGFYGKTQVASGIVAGADLLLGASVAPILDAMQEAGGGLLKGVRTPVAAHKDPVVRSNPVPVAEGLMLSEAFIAGATELLKRGLSLDLWVYQTQLHEVVVLAQTLPDLTIIVNHAGGPLGIGPYSSNQKQHFESWQKALVVLAQCPNIVLKLGGFGMPIMGFAWHEKPLPPTSIQLAQAIAPYIHSAVKIFGSERCLFESNFPVDKGSFSYAVFWNAMLRISAEYSKKERSDLFSKTAMRVYRL